VHQHQREERPKIFDPIHRQDRNAANQVTYRHEFLRCEITVGELIAEEHGGDGRDGKCVVHPSALPVVEVKASLHIAVDQREPRAPDQKLEDHHQEKFKADC
jgi:hypothetical protein